MWRKRFSWNKKSECTGSDENRVMTTEESARFDTMRLIRCFSKFPVIKEIGVQPSVYVNELLMPYRERLAQLEVDCGELFAEAPARSLYDRWDVRPRFVFFNNWAPREEHEAVFSLRNKYRSSKLVKARLKDGCEVFTLEEMTRTRRLASMVTVSYRVRFRPREMKDYLHTALITSEQETFPVYILALSPRPMINFPDKIDFGEALVNFKNVKKIKLTNIGKISTTVTFEIIGAIRVSEEKITLNPDEECCLTVILNSRRIGLINSQIIAIYETGEKVFINVTADCQRGNIHIEKNHVTLDKTYIGLKSTASLWLRNDTSHIIKFKWLRTEDTAEDENIHSKLSSQLMGMMRLQREVAITDDLEEYDQIMGKVLDDETNVLRQNYYFCDASFDISPMEGSVWPNTCMNFHITFLPTMAIPYQTVAYLEAEGLLSRIKVSFQGSSMGPTIAFNLNNIDCGKIFLCNSHTYVVMVRNTGNVKGTLAHTPGDILCGGKIVCEPSRMELLPDETKYMEIQVSSTIVGHFVEDILFQIEESKEVHKISIQGEVINPRLIMDKSELDFGDIALGMPFERTVRVHNDSSIKVEVELRVEGDGNMPAVRIDQDYDLHLPDNYNPKEFHLEPESAAIQPGASVSVNVRLISNKVREHKSVLGVWLRGVLVEEASVPLRYRSVIPQLVARPPEIVLRYAFVGYEYCHELTIHNQSSLPTYFAVLPQQELYNPYILYHLENESGFLDEHCSQVVKVYIKVLSLKPCKERLRLRVFGLNNAVHASTIKAFGMGPVVNPSAFNINWGQIPIMEKVEKKFHLINVSPIPAYYKINFMRHPDVWTVDHQSGHIGPDSSSEVVLTARILDSGMIEDQLWVEISGSRDIKINLSACGQGISIFTDPVIFPVYDIGSVFKHEKQSQIIKVTNVGNKHHTLLFTTSKDFKKMTKLTAEKEQGKYFKLNPYRLDLPGGSTQEMILSYKWNDDAVLEDTYYCYGTINNTGKRIMFGTSTIRAKFTDPQFFTEPSEVYMRTDVSEHDTVIEPLHQTLKLKSLWSTKLAVICSSNRPFRFDFVTVDKKVTSQNLVLEPGSTYTLEIFFDPPNVESRRTRVIRDLLTIKYIGHTVKTFINLTGEINFPNVSLSPKIIDFGCVEPGGECVCLAEMKNTSPLTVNFEWDWQEKSITFLKDLKNSIQVMVDPEDPELPSMTSEINEGEMESEFSLNTSIDVGKEEKVFNKAERQSFYKNLLREKYNTDEGKLPKNLEVLITELMGAKYEMEKAIQASGKKKQELMLEWGKKIRGNVEGCGTTDNDTLDNSSFGQDSLGMSDGFKQAMGIISPCHSSDESLDIKSLLQSCPQNLMEGETITSLEQCLKKGPLIKQEVPDKEGLDLSKVLDISPCRETLEPKECLNITLRFSPPCPMKLVAEAICKVRGGPSQDLQITGFSYPLDYEVFPEIINFGLGPFCEVWCSSLIVWNKSLKEIKVVVTTPCRTTFLGDTSNTSTMPLSVGIIPSKIYVKPFESSIHQVLIYPGRVGEIDQLIFVQVDNEEPIQVHFVGYATPHQIYIGVPHLLEAEDRLEEYHSIARLTSFWFELNLMDLLPSSILEFELDEIFEQIQETYVQGDWDLLMGRDDLVPTVDDINMAYERYICEKFAKTLDTFIPMHAPTKAGCRTFLNLKFPTYVIDFGLVIAGTKAVYNVPYCNYLPMKTEIRVIYPSDIDTLNKFGVNLKMPKTQQLKGFDESSFEITIRPLKDIFKGEEFESKMSFDFHIEVTCGGVIPITVKALITHPVLVAPHCIDFDGIKLGYRSVVRFKLQNISKVDCEWIAVITPAKNMSYYFGKKGKAGIKTSPFHITPVCGYLNPNHYTMITTVFEPRHEIPYEADINFYANMNNRYMKVRLRGYGIEPKLLIRNISFGYTIPFSEPIKKHLVVYNPALFPLEVYIHGEDRQQLLQKDVFRCFMKYYKKSVVCLPSHFFTTHGTNEMWKMYKRFAKAAIEKYVQDTGTFLTILLKQNYSKISSKKFESETNKFKSFKKVGNSKGITLKSLYIKRLKPERHRLSFVAAQKIDIMDYLVAKELPRKSLSAIIREYIESTNTFKCHHINFAKSLRKFETHHANTFKDGNIIILHHSPFSHPGTFAWLLKKHTGIQPVSLDKVIYTEIKEGISEESLLIRDKLFNYYLQERSNYQNWTHTDVSSRETFEKVLFPIKTLKGLLKFAHRNYFRIDDLRFFKPSRKSIPRPESSVLLGIAREHFHAILLRRLCNKLEKGILIKSLSSKFFATPIETLNFLLDLFKLYRNLNVISLYTTIEQSFRINKNVLDGEVIDFFYKMTGENILEASPSYIKKVGEEFFEQKKILNKSISSTPEKKKGPREKLSNSRFTTTSRKGKPGRIKIVKSAKELEIETKFFFYQKEVLEIQALLEDYERMISPVSEYASHAEHSSTMTSGLFRRTLQIKKKDHSQVLHKLDLKVDEKIGVPFWLLYHYPYTEDYQFSVYPECLSSLGIVWHQSQLEKEKRESLQHNRLNSKSYFVISKLPKGISSSKYISKNKLFSLSPVLKLRKKKIYKKSSDGIIGYNGEEEASFERLEDKTRKKTTKRATSNKEYSVIDINPSLIDSFKTETRKTSLAPHSESTTKSNESLVNALIKVGKYCNNLQEDLLKELHNILLSRCRDKLTRQVVKPSKFVSWEVQFEPRGCTVFNQCIPLGISGCDAMKCVNIFAGCDIPDIEFIPTTLFAEVNRQTTDLEEVFKPCYLILKNLFHFGMVITNASNNVEGTFTSSAQVKIKNISNVNVFMTISTISEEKCNSVSMTHQSTRVRSVEKIASRREKTLSSLRRSRSSKLKKTKSTVSSKTFSCDQAELLIEPGGIKHITISSSPVKQGIQTRMYVFSIENNPKVYLLKTVVHGINVKVEFRPREITFEEVVLYRSVSKCFLIDNISKMPLKWRVLDPDSLEPLIVLSKNEGLLNPLGQDPVSITYQANSVERVTKDLVISVYSPTKEAIELQRHTFKLVLKSYSVDVNFHFSSSGNDHLELGNIGVNELITSSLIIENCGPHSITYSVLPKFDEEMFSLRDSLKVIVHDEVGRLKSHDTNNIEVTITCNAEIQLKAMPFISIEIYDYNSEELIARIPGLISLNSYFPQFIVRPTQTLNFGNLEIGSSKRLEIILENPGYIDISFRFLSHKFVALNPEEIEDFDENDTILVNKSNKFNKISSLKASLQNLNNLALLKKVLLIESRKLLAEQIHRKLKFPVKNLSKKKFSELVAKLDKVKMKLNIIKKKERHRKRKIHAVPISGPHKKTLESPDVSSVNSALFTTHKLLTFDGSSSTAFQVAPFEIFPAKGVVEPGDRQVCSVICCPINVGTFQKGVSLRIFNAQPEKCSIPFQLLAKCSVPKTNLGNYDSVFREFKIVSEMPTSDKNNEGLPYALFCNSLKTIRFYNVIVGLPGTFNVYIQSENHLPATIHISLEDNNEIFTLEDQENSLHFSIPPYQTRAVPIKFFPYDLSEYRTKLKISLKTTKNNLIETAIFLLQGEGCLPTLEVVQDNISDNIYALGLIHKVDFQYVHLESTSTKCFTIRNTGAVTCDFWIEMLKASDDFIIQCTPEAMVAALLKLDNANFDSSTVFRLKPAESISFEVIFKPAEVGIRTMVVPIHITYNPYEQINLKLIGEAFHNDIMIKGLECVGANILSTTASSLGNLVEYKLDFGNCCCGSQLKRNFIIKNNTQHIIRFEMINESCPEIIFVPSIGHIFRASMKEVNAYLIASLPGTITAACSVLHNGMVYKDDTTIVDWDNSFKVISCLEEQKIYLDIGSRIHQNTSDLPPFEEPPFTLLTFVSGEIPITVSAVVDRPAFKVSVNEITYTPVLIGQLATYTFNVKNISNVEANFELAISDERSINANIHRDLADFTFGPFNYELLKLSKFETEPSETCEDRDWPKNLPPDLEVYDYYNIFLMKQHDGNPEKWDYLRLKTVTKIHDLPGKEFFPDIRENTSDTLCAVTSHSDILHDATIEFEETTEEVEQDDTKDGDNTYYDRQSVFWTDIKYGSVKPSESLNIQLMFSPKQSCKYEATVKFLGEFDQSMYNVSVNGMGYLPLCHIEINNNDYITKHKLQLDKIPFQTKAVIVNSFSTESIVRKEFIVYNTTEIPFHFKWYCLKTSSKEQKFKCFTSEGNIAPQSKGEMLFSFCSLEYGVYEALWLLCIKEFILQQPILFVGISKDPEITVEPKCIILKPLYKSSKTSAELILTNHEDSSFMFSIDEESLIELRSKCHSFNITPTNGHLEPKSTFKINVEYIPDLLIEQSINVVINIEPSNKNLPFMICINKYMVLPLIYCVKQNYERIDLNFEEKDNYYTLSLDKCTLREPIQLTFTISNIGEIPLHIEFLSQDSENASSLEIEEESGLVFPSKSVSFNVQIMALKEGCFKHPLTIKVSDGPRLHLSLIGTGVSPLFKFSFDFYDFGVCLIQKTDPLMHSVILQFSNLSTNTVLLESEDCKGCFSMNLKSLLVPPRSLHNILICFNPVEADYYENTLMFKINNTFEYSVKLTGEGDFFNVEIDDPECQLVDFGLVNAGKLVSKEVTLVNNSKVSSNFTVYSIERNEITTIKLNIKPAGKVIKLAPGETCVLEINFFGTERLKDYSSAVMFSAYGEKGILFCVKASVIDYEIYVDQRALLFDPTTIGCPTTLKFAIINSGDIGTRFLLDTNLLSEVFAVKPVTGYSCPGATTIIEVTFIPNTPMQYHNNMILCTFENYRTISVTVTGVGVSLPTPMKTIKFLTTVRAQTARYVTLNNSLSVEQTVHAMLDGEYYSGERYIRIPPHGSAKYEIYYNPLTQTKHHFHLGSLFCAFSSGSSVLYKLIGTSLPPNYSSKLTWYCQARKKIFGSIPLESFSPTSEMYEFTLQCDHASSTVFYILEASDTISLPANSKREFTIGLVCYKECTLEFTAIFKNTCSEEYHKFQIILNVEEPGPRTVCVRSTVGIRESWKVPLINPLKKKTTFVLQSYHPEIVPRKKIVQVKPGKKVGTKISYLNISSTNTEAIPIKIHNQYLGEEMYTLFVSTIKPFSGEEFIFKANIGSSATYWIPITNCSSKLCSCRIVASNELVIKKPFFTIPSGKTYKLEVEFIPAEFGTVLLEIKVITTCMGLLIFPVKGIGHQPKLQGSYTISRGGTLKVNFTNVFNTKTNFVCEVNSQDFLVRTPSFTLLPKEVIKIEIQHLYVHNILPLNIAASYCKVLVSSTNHEPNLQWIHYVRTMPEEDNGQTSFY